MMIIATQGKEVRTAVTLTVRSLIQVVLLVIPIVMGLSVQFVQAVVGKVLAIVE